TEYEKPLRSDLRWRAVMGKVTCDISMSLDGFIAGSNVRVGNGMGDDGDRLHAWVFGGNTETDDAIVAEKNASPGAILIGKRMFDVGLEPWGELREAGVHRDARSVRAAAQAGGPTRVARDGAGAHCNRAGPAPARRRWRSKRVCGAVGAAA